MSSISRLPLTKAVDEHSKVGGWDEQFGDESWQSLSFRASIASHAVAHQTVVCGTNNRNDEEWIAWTTSFAPHRVCRVANNNNGTIIAASLDNGVVSIMRGSDGVQLVTRRVASEGMRIPAEIFFISGEHSDILVIDTPEDGHPIMVSNINGERLNDRENKGIVSEATRSMVIHELEFEGFHDIRAIQGCYFEQHKVRFALVDGDGKLAIYDYLLEQKKAVLLQKSLSVGGKEEDWEIDLDTGLRLQTVGSGNTYLVLGAYSRNENTSKLCWFDLEQLVVSQDHILSKNGLKRSRFLALEPIESQSKVGSLAVVVALKRAGDRLETTVLQAAFDDGVVGQPHAVYKIPVPQSVQSISIASLSVKRHGPFSFRCKTWLGGDKHDCHSFSTANQHHDGSAIASIRLLAMREQFEGAESLVHKIGADALVNDPFAQFHTSEIYLRSLNSILSKGSVENENTMNISRECIRQLVSGALSGMEHGQRALLSAANSILQWPDETALQNPPTISEVTMALVGFISEITNLSDAFRDTLASEFETKQRELEEKHLALKYLQSIVDKDVPINSQFAGVGSIKDLFLCLIQNNYFLAAEQMWRSDLRSKITSDSMVSALLGVSSTVNPRRYASLLQDTIKGLAINHQLLPALHVWSCKNADEFDDKMGNQSSLDDAIFLLEVSLWRFAHQMMFFTHSSFITFIRLWNGQQRIFVYVSIPLFHHTPPLLKNRG